MGLVLMVAIFSKTGFGIYLGVRHCREGGNP